MRNQESAGKNTAAKRGKRKIKSFASKRNKFFQYVASGSWLLALSFQFSPAIAAEGVPVLSVVQSQENANQWGGITNRLQATGVKYCVIPLATVKTAADWGDRRVLFLPNIESLTPAQAIALEEWISKGGRVIVSGPLGTLSAPGVRQLLRSLLGAYWGFSLNTPTNLETTKTKTPEWVRQSGLNGSVRGGVVIPTDLTSQAAAVWNSKDNPPAVVATERSTFLGWRWGVDAASPAVLDTAWLKATINRYLQLPAANNLTGASQNCPPAAPIAAAPPAKPKPQARTAAPQASPKPEFSPGRVNQPQQTAVAPRPKPLPTATPSPEDPINRLEQEVRLDVVPNSKEPISNLEASALEQDLKNLIGRVESAHLAANAIGSNPQAKVDNSAVQVASLSPQFSSPRTAEAIAQAREVVKKLPQLISQRDYAGARAEWLAARSNLWKQFPTDRPLAQPEIRAMWLDRGTIVRAGSQQGLAKIFDRMAQAGINTVFFETVNAGYPIYPSQVAPAQNPLVKGWDPLAAAVKLAHERDMELHAWVWAFAGGNEKHNTIIGKPKNYPGPVIAAHPNWASYDNRGSLFPIGQGKPFLDPANAEVRRYLLKLYDEIISRYQVDGLHLDYIRYPFQDPGADRTYGYGKAAREQFQQLYGVDPTKISPRGDRDLWQKWTEFRTQQIDSFVAEVSQQLRQKRPNLILSAAVFPLPEHERMQKLQQRWEIWAQRGDVDIIVPMTYALDTYRFQRLAQPWITSPKLGNALILPGIRLLNLPLIGAFDQIQLVRDLPVSGYALFAAENLNNDLYKVFNSTQGSGQGTASEPVPYREPFQTATARYAALQREWNFVLSNNQLRLQPAALSAFNTQSEILAKALSQLSSDPSLSRLAAAKASLAAFKSQFKDWMRPHSLENSYQVKVWENRLATIERLLSYGEGVQLQRNTPPVAEQPNR